MRILAVDSEHISSDEIIKSTMKKTLKELNLEDDFLFATERYDRKILDTSKELMGRKFH